LTVYASLCEGLRARGWEILPVWAGKLPTVHGTARLGESFEILARESSDVQDCAGALARWVRERRCDILFTAGEPFALASLPDLPARTRVVAKCPAQSRHAYRLVTADLSRTDLILVETARQHEDLTRRWRVPERKCALIMHGIHADSFRPSTIRDFTGTLRLVYTGRLEDATKHVMLVPEIAGALTKKGVPFQMKIIGDGPDRMRLEERISARGLMKEVTLLGSVPREQIPRLLQEAHVAVIPSLLEGGCFALLESMACGCVPAVSHIHQTTDMVVQNGVNGFLCRVGDARAFAKAITALANDRAQLESMSLAARRTIEVRFTIGRMVDAYDHALAELLNRPPGDKPSASGPSVRATHLPLDPWRTLVPRSAKNLVRMWAERFGITV
jgi:glycosyltransferase involved in cell wall biosynthesis